MNIDELVKKAAQTIPRADEHFCLGRGADGLVYAIDENAVLKLHLGWLEDGVRQYYRGSSRESADYEFKIGSDLHRQGVQVPQYFGLFEPIKLSFWGAFTKKICGAPPPLKCWGVFMERIHGVRLGALSNLPSIEAAHQYHKQKKLISKLGYAPYDNYIHKNTLFDVKKNRLFLYDLVRWEKK